MSKLTGYAIPTVIPGADHTYVKSDDPAFSWGCWGRNTGGKEICSGSADASIANCISQVNSHAGIIYGITGVCHQTANRILFPAGVTVSKAGGYNVSRFAYGVYGLNTKEWTERLARCGISRGKSRTETPVGRRTPSSEEGEKAYLQKVMAIYTEASQREDDFLSLPARELELTMEFYLGGSLEPDIISSVQKLQSDFLQEKSEIDHEFYGGDIGIEKWVQEGNDLFTGILRQAAEDVGNKNFELIFGISPPKDGFILIDPDIATKVHSSKQ
jgi:hypothetical protein